MLRNFTVLTPYIIVVGGALVVTELCTPPANLVLPGTCMPGAPSRHLIGGYSSTVPATQRPAALRSRIP